jgi:hypothetical protein
VRSESIEGYLPPPNCRAGLECGWKWPTTRARNAQRTGGLPGRLGFTREELGLRRVPTPMVGSRNRAQMRS